MPSSALAFTPTFEVISANTHTSSTASLLPVFRHFLWNVGKAEQVLGLLNIHGSLFQEFLLLLQLFVALLFLLAG